MVDIVKLKQKKDWTKEQQPTSEQKQKNTTVSSTEPTVRPHRAYQLDVKIEADSREDVDRAVLALLQALERDWKGMNTQRSISGGVNWGWVVTLKHDQNMTHEQYFDDIERFKESNKKIST